MATVEPDWGAQARCLGEDPELFFTPGYEDEAKALCAACGVQESCFRYALETRQDDGVWGGLTAGEREAYLRSATPVNYRLTLLSVTYTTRARTTGATCSAGRTEEGWGVACVSHDRSALSRSRTDAEAAVSRPQEWCPECRPIAAGRAPHLKRN